MRLTRAVLAGVVLILLAGCGPRPAPGPATSPPPVCWKYPNNSANATVQQAILKAFGHLGQGVVNEAGRVACCESGWGPRAVNGQYRGLFQLGSNFNGTIAFYGGDVFNAYTNAQVARDSYIQRGHSWSAFSCRP